jgi:hypothetical protein
LAITPFISIRRTLRHYAHIADAERADAVAAIFALSYAITLAQHATMPLSLRWLLPLFHILATPLRRHCH